MKLARWLLTCSILLSIALPFIPLALWSFSERWFYPALLPQDMGLRAWKYIFDTAGSQIFSGLLNSAILAFTTTMVSLIFGIPAGRALGLYDFPGKKLVVIIFTLPLIVPPLTVSMGLHFWFIKLSFAETFPGIVLIHLTFCLPYTIFVIMGVFTDYDPDFEDQARSLGASALTILFQIVFPLIRPGIIIAALFSFLLSWSQYLGTLIIGGGKILTLPILLFSLMLSGDRPVAAAVSLIFIFPVFIVLMYSAHNLGRHGNRGIR